jgi:hypothetical protein
LQLLRASCEALRAPFHACATEYSDTVLKPAYLGAAGITFHKMAEHFRSVFPSASIEDVFFLLPR